MNLDKLTEGAQKIIYQSENQPGRKYKPRRKSELDKEELDSILDSYFENQMQHQDIAKKYRVTNKLVRDLICEAKRR